MFLLPCFFFSWILLRVSLVFWGVFCLFSKVFRRLPDEKILGIFEVFLGIFEKTKEKKDRQSHQPRNFHFVKQIGLVYGSLLQCEFAVPCGKKSHLQGKTTMNSHEVKTYKGGSRDTMPFASASVWFCKLAGLVSSCMEIRRCQKHCEGASRSVYVMSCLCTELQNWFRYDLCYVMRVPRSVHRTGMNTAESKIKHKEFQVYVKRNLSFSLLPRIVNTYLHVCNHQTQLVQNGSLYLTTGHSYSGKGCNKQLIGRPGNKESW